MAWGKGTLPTGGKQQQQQQQEVHTAPVADCWAAGNACAVLCCFKQTHDSHQNKKQLRNAEAGSSAAMPSLLTTTHPTHSHIQPSCPYTVLMPAAICSSVRRSPSATAATSCCMMLSLATNILMAECRLVRCAVTAAAAAAVHTHTNYSSGLPCHVARGWLQQPALGTQLKSTCTTAGMPPNCRLMCHAHRLLHVRRFGPSTAAWCDACWRPVTQAACCRWRPECSI